MRHSGEMTRFQEKSVSLWVLVFSVLTTSAQAGAAEKVAEVLNVKGMVEVLGSGGELRVLERGSELYAMETVITGQDGRAKIRFVEGKNEIVVGTATRLQIQSASVDLQKPGTSLFLESGEVRSTVNRKYSGQGRDVFEVKTPNSVAGVRGTVFQVGYDVRQNSTVVATLRGLVSVQAGASPAALVAAGQFTMTMRGVLQQVRAISKDPVMSRQLERFERAAPKESASSFQGGSNAKDAALANNAAGAAGLRSAAGISEAQKLSEKFGFPVESTLNFVKSDAVSDADKEKAIRNIQGDSAIRKTSDSVALDMMPSPSFVQPKVGGNVAAEAIEAAREGVNNQKESLTSVRQISDDTQRQAADSRRNSEDASRSAAVNRGAAPNAIRAAE